MIAWVAVAWAADCENDPCACEEQRANGVSRALEPLEATATARQSSAAWRATAAATCTWAETIASASGPVCLPTASCVRLLAESRLNTLTSLGPAARVTDLQHLTGRYACAPEAGPTCAIEARRTEEERLVGLIHALTALHLDPHESERYWLGYRDSACIVESRDSGQDLAWAQAACEAVRTVRRADLLAQLAVVADPESADPLSEARLALAGRELHASPRPYRRWLTHVGNGLEARDAVRELVEARADGALDPALLATSAWSACAKTGSEECLTAVAAETRARRDSAAPSLASEPEERAWRARWCGHGTAVEQLGCQASIDLVVAEAHR